MGKMGKELTHHPRTSSYLDPWLEIMGPAEGPSATAERFFRLIEEGRIDPAVDLLSKEKACAADLSRLATVFSAYSDEMSRRGGIERVEVRTQTFSRDDAELHVLIWFVDRSFSREAVEVVREDACWKLSIAELSREFVSEPEGRDLELEIGDYVASVGEHQESLRSPLSQFEMQTTILVEAWPG